MVNTVLFLLVIFGANIMQGITGFAGTILAMSPSLLLVGYDIAKPVLNVLALISGAYVFLGNVKYVNWRELWKIVVWMAAGHSGGGLDSGPFCRTGGDSAKAAGGLRGPAGFAGNLEDVPA